MMKRLLMLSGLVLVACFTLAMAQEKGVKKARPLPQDYGRVVLRNFSEQNRMAPVVFDHWLHRTQFTCGVCHVDLAFAMTAGATGVHAADNMNGLYCGSCHDGKRKVDGRVVFKACGKERDPNGACDRCHSWGKEVRKEYTFAQVTARFPRERFGNGINWEKAEALGFIRPSDYLEGASIRKQAMPVQKDFALEPRQVNMPEIIFSHQKHTVWNGCAVCHPEPFVGVSRGATRYSMVEIFEGRYCGVCHGTVAFPNIDCQRCHAKPVS